MDNPLEVKVDKVQRVPCIRLIGEVDMGSAHTMAAALEQLMDEGDAHIIVDLTGVSYIDSTGLSVLIRAQRRLNDIPGTIALIFDRPHISRLLDITGMSQIFRVYQSEADFVPPAGQTTP